MAAVLQTLADAPTPATDPMGSEARKSAYRIAELLSQQGLDTSPISSPWQGLARLAQAGFGGWDRSLLEKEERAQTAAFRKLLNQDPRLATGEAPAPQDRVATALAGVTPPAPREGDAVLPRMQTPPAPREGALPPPTSGPRPPTAPPLIQQPVRQATEGAMPAEGLPGSGYGDDSYRMPLDQMRPPQTSVRQALAGPGATGPTPSPAPANGMAPLPGSDAPIVPKQVQAVPVQPPSAPPQSRPHGSPPPYSPVAAATQVNRVPTLMTPEIARQIRAYNALGTPAALQKAEALTQQYSKPTEYDFKVVEGKLVRTDKLGNHTIVEDATKKPKAVEDLEYAMTNWQKLNLPDPASADPKQQNFWKELSAKALGGGGVNVQIDQSAPNEFEKEYGQGMGKRAISVLEAGDKATTQIQRVQLAQQMLNSIQTGKLTSATSTAGGWLQAIGVDPSKFGINPSTPMTAEALGAITNEMVIGKIGAGGFPANNFSDADRKFLTGAVFALGDRPEANFIKLEVAKRLAEFDAHKADAWAEARGNKVSYEQFERDWRKQTQAQNIFGDLIEKAGAFGAQPGQQGGPVNQDQLRTGIEQQFGGAQPAFNAALEEAKRRGWKIPGMTQ